MHNVELRRPKSLNNDFGRLSYMIIVAGDTIRCFGQAG